MKLSEAIKVADSHYNTKVTILEMIKKQDEKRAQKRMEYFERLSMATKTKLQIGCKRYSIKCWLKHYEEIGRAEGMSKEEIAEYLLYIKLANKLYGNKEQPCEK